MAGPPRYFGVRGENNESGSRNPPHYALAVRPLNSVPYIGSPSPVGDNASSPTEGDTEPVKTVGPSMVFLSSTTTQKELDNVLASAKGGVILSGSAATGSIGPLLGKMNLAESDDSYLFRVALPGVSRDEKEFSCDIEPDGKVIIRGVRTTGEKVVCKYSQVFKMQSQNLGPPGRFSISFHLPGPVDHQQFTGSFGDDGILEGIVKKMQLKCEI